MSCAYHAKFFCEVQARAEEMWIVMAIDFQVLCWAHFKKMLCSFAACCAKPTDDKTPVDFNNSGMIFNDKHSISSRNRQHCRQSFLRLHNETILRKTRTWLVVFSFIKGRLPLIATRINHWPSQPVESDSNARTWAVSLKIAYTPVPLLLHCGLYRCYCIVALTKTSWHAGIYHRNVSLACCCAVVSAWCR